MRFNPHGIGFNFDTNTLTYDGSERRFEFRADRSQGIRGYYCLVYMRRMNKIAIFRGRTEPVIVKLPRTLWSNYRLRPAVHVWDDTRVDVRYDVVRDAFGCMTGESDRCEPEDYVRYDRCGRLIPPKPDCSADEIYNYIYGAC